LAVRETIEGIEEIAEGIEEVEIEEEALEAVSIEAEWVEEDLIGLFKIGHPDINSEMIE
jgi:hypothetical protein